MKYGEQTNRLAEDLDDATTEPQHDERTALDSVRRTVSDVAGRLRAIEREAAASADRPRPAADGEVAFEHELVALRDEVSSIAADVVVLAADRSPTPALQRQVAELTAQCTDLPSLRAVVTRLEQDLESRMQESASSLESTVDELDAKVTQALACITTASDAARLSSDAMLREARRLDAGMEARIQEAIDALEATRLQLQRQADRAVDTSNRALARTDGLVIRDAQLARVEAELHRLDERLSMLVRELEETPSLVEIAREAFEALRATVVGRVSSWFAVASRS